MSGLDLSYCHVGHWCGGLKLTPKSEPGREAFNDAVYLDCCEERRLFAHVNQGSVIELAQLVANMADGFSPAQREELLSHFAEILGGGAQ